MAAEGGAQLASELRSLVPSLPPPAAAAVALAALAVGAGALLLGAFQRRRSPDVQTRVQALPDIQRGVDAALATDTAQNAILNLGLEIIPVQQAVHADLAAAAAADLAPPNLPYWDTKDKANGFLSSIYDLLLQGQVDQATFNAVQSWVVSELERIDLGITAQGIQADSTLRGRLKTLPTFGSVGEANAFQAEAFSLVQRGWLNNEGFSRIQAWDLQELARLQSQPAPAAPPATVPSITAPAPAVVGTSPEVSSAIAALQAGVAGLTAGSLVTAQQIAAIQAQLTTLTGAIAAPRQTVTETPGLTTAVGVGAAGVAAALATTLPAALAKVAAQGAGPNAHAAQMARYGCQGSFLDPLLQVAGKLLPQAIAGSVLIFDNPVKAALQQQVTDLLESQLDPAKFSRPLTYEQAVDNASHRLLQAIGFGLTAQGIAYTAEAMTPLKQMGFNQLAGFLGDLAGFKRIADGLMGTVETAAIYTPLRWEASRRFRPMLPQGGQLVEMLGKRAISAAEYADYMEREGFDELVISRSPEYIYADPSLRALTAAFQLAPPGPEFDGRPEVITTLERAGLAPGANNYVRYKLLKARLDPLDVEAMSSVLVMGIVKREQAARYSALTNLYKHGYIDRARALREIALAQTPAPVAEYRQAALDLEAEYELTAEIHGLVAAAVQKGLVSDEDGSAQLTALGMRPERIRTTILRARVGLAPRDAAEAFSPSAPAPVEAVVGGS